MQDDLKIIKKLYGEDMMHLCRNLFPSVLEKQGVLVKALRSTFYPGKFICEDLKAQDKIEQFENHILNLVSKNDELDLTITDKSPHELFKSIGYKLYECETNKDIQSFKKYYYPGEELCTFFDNRLSKCHVFFAVKTGAEKLIRENFKNPERQDEYGTSVISIQFTRGSNNLSIKNRYNHTVINPDATFCNNLENIVPGLTRAFEKHYNLNINQNTDSNFELENYTWAEDGLLYKYNYEINGIYYCPNNMLIEYGEPIKLPSEKRILIDYFILDLESKCLMLYSQVGSSDDFENSITNIQKITITKLPNSTNKKIEIITDEEHPIIVIVDKYNRIIKYDNKNLKLIGRNFLKENTVLNEINIPNVTRIGHNFLLNNLELKSISLSKVELISDYFLFNNNIYLRSVDLPLVKRIGRAFLSNNVSLVYVNFPNLIEVGDYFFSSCRLEEIKVPKLTYIGNYFLYRNKTLRKLSLPEALQLGNYFLETNEILEFLSAPEASVVGDDFLNHNLELSYMHLPSITVVGDRFLSSNTIMKAAYFPLLKRTGTDFFEYNHSIEIDAPLLLEESFDETDFTETKCRKILPLPHILKKEVIKNISKFLHNKIFRKKASSTAKTKKID